MRFVVVVLVACGHSPAPIVVGDGGTDAPVGDAPVGDAPDAAPATLVGVTPAPGTETWLHAPIRLAFSGPVAVAQASVTAEVDGVAAGASIALETADTIAVTIDPAARGTSTLDIHVDGLVVPVAAHYTLRPWRHAAVDGAIAVTAAGDVLVAHVGSTGVIVEQLDRGPLGDPLGTATSTSPAIAIDAAGHPIVAWCDAGQAHLASWNGAWHEQVSPGPGTAVALAEGAVAVFGSTVQIRDFQGNSLGNLAMPSSIVGPPAFAGTAIGWVDAAGAHVYRHDQTWTALPTIAGATHVSVAARSGTIAVAWDAWAGSSGVLAAIATGSSWTQLGHLLDVDPIDDAIAPAIALDSTGAPIVAWTELIEGRARGIVARWTGTAWSIAGGASFLDDDSVRPTGTRLALHAGDAPVVAAGGTVARYNGSVAPAIARTSIAGCAISATNPPAQLSQTGCFTGTTPHPGLVPYGVVSPLWTDGAKKRRWIGLPDGATMTPSATGAWAAPAGTIMVKEFAIETTPGDPATRRPVETRFLVQDPQLGWQGFSYRWNLAGTDATLQPDQDLTFAWPMDDGSTHVHDYPSRSECLSCHEGSYGPLLGIRPPQLARWFDYGGTIGDQLAILAQLGVGPGTTAVPFVAPHDPSETWEHRMRGYMADNCAHCHNPDHIAILDMRYTTPLAQTNLCSKIVPGSPAQSIVYQKISSRPGMPPLGTLAIDPLAVQMLGNWISAMTSCP